MKQIASVCLAAALASVARSGPVENSILAAMRLSDQSNYSWISTVADDARTYEITGQTSHDGFTRVQMPVVNSIRQRLGRRITDTRMDVIYRGNVRCALLTEGQWKTVDELPWEPDDDEYEAMAAKLGPQTGSIMPASSLGSFPGMGSITATRRREELRPRPYSNLQLAISPPHQELAVIVSSNSGWQLDGDTVHGTLTDLGAQLLLVHDGQKEIEPLRAAGTFTLWIRGGIVTKYQLNLEGVLSVVAKMARREIEVQQTSTTVLRDIGTTKLEVPEEARRKLSHS